jgi:hypothetical protein
MIRPVPHETHDKYNLPILTHICYVLPPHKYHPDRNLSILGRKYEGVSISDFSIYVAGLPPRREESAAKLNFDGGMKLVNTSASSANELTLCRVCLCIAEPLKYLNAYKYNLP